MGKKTYIYISSGSIVLQTSDKLSDSYAASNIGLEYDEEIEMNDVNNEFVFYDYVSGSVVGLTHTDVMNIKNNL